VCDGALDLTLGYNDDAKKKRSGGGEEGEDELWYYDDDDDDALAISRRRRRRSRDREGDFSVMYAMHYFNDVASLRARSDGR